MTEAKANAAATAVQERTVEKSDKQVLDEVLNIAESTAKEIGMSKSELALIKDMYAKGATDEELALFIKTASRLGLSIEARQIFLVPRWDSKLQREVKTPQVSIDGSRLVAERTGKYVPGREPVYEYEGGKVKKATAFIKKFVEGQWHEIAAHAFFGEYVQTNKEGKPNSTWAKMPHIMLAKCAESLALRKAFPNELSGVYTDAEMGTDPAQIIGAERQSNGTISPPKSENPSQPKPPSKSELVEKAKSTIDVDGLKSQIVKLGAAIGMQESAEKTLKFIDENPKEAERAYCKAVRVSFRKLTESDKWPYADEGTAAYLEKHGITVLDDASRGQLESLVDQLESDGLLTV